MEKTLNYAEQVLAEAPDGQDYEWKTEYTGHPTMLMRIRHVNNCGFEFELSPADFAAGKRCYIHLHCGWIGSNY
ncbi:MAG: hypothetical protein LKG79_00860 [Furfurilactobacillus sp.]|jgi:hypothetical protein|uniref:Uncharacterized protein n=1 Tax=Furfurilactobacillus milii TaxID=2888272 RepID=A0ABT6D9E0_9LACO|nr:MULTISPECIES: hypothetical protein [Furfurilactobacillus]QLE66371.1 hypothetical protein LROSL2_1021 [Furfurilactobacillus rossiae]MCF6159827.1 hypothetical protein [Furfurilactobacillus milii]MCF6162624.1 hypothetical protein [Furfurilactobacillus milii]MCF6419205.1 hypothetical protein [Furfurilactobacillus milii]MCH4010918.1 hypothetical protein [Furfurilactobacillus sp.]